MKKQNEMTETALTVDELKRMGEILSDMREQKGAHQWNN